MATKKTSQKQIRMIEDPVPTLGVPEEKALEEELKEEVTEITEVIDETGDPEDEIQEQEPEDPEEEPEAEDDEDDEGDEDESPVLTDEYILMEKILVTHPNAPVFSIIRDVLDDSDPDRWDNILLDLERRDMYARVYDLRDGYLTELGKHYARFTLGLTPDI